MIAIRHSKCLAFGLILALQPILAYAYIGGGFPGEDFPGAVSWSWSGFTCSGTKLNNGFILTSAHCFLNQTEFDLKRKMNKPFIIGGPLGSYTDPNHVSTKVVQIIIHEDWPNDQDTKSDLALIKVEEAGPRPAVNIGTLPVNLKNEVIVGGFGCKGPGYPDYAHLTVGMKVPQEIHLGELIFGVSDSDATNASMGCPGDSGGGVYRINEISHTLEVVGMNHSINIFENEMPFLIKVDAKSGTLVSWKRDPILRATNLTEPHILEWLQSKLSMQSIQ